jgi:hypothetical protein
MMLQPPALLFWSVNSQVQAAVYTGADKVLIFPK